MRIVVLILLLTVPSVAGLSFNSPATVEGAVVYEGPLSAYVDVGQQGSIEASFALNASELVRHTYPFTILHVEAGPPPNDSYLWGRPESERRDVDGQLVGTAVGTDGPSGIVIEAAWARVTVEEVLGQIGATRQCRAEGTTSQERDGRQFRFFACPGPEVFVAARHDNHTVAISIEAVGVRRLEFYNVSVACDTDACPAGGGRSYMTPPATSPVGIRQGQDEYGEVLARNGTVQLTGMGAGVVGFASRMDATIDGLSRFPAADMGHGEESSRQTLAFLGEVDLGALRVASGDSGRLEGRLAVEDAIARRDEVLLDSLPTAAATVGLVLLLASLPKVLAGLLTSLGGRQALKHPNRRALMRYIEAHPGTTFRELVRATGISTGTARHHVQILMRSGLIAQKEHRQTHRYFALANGADEAWEATVLLREPELRLLYEWLAQNPQSPQKAILAASSTWGWSRSTTQHRLRRLTDGGLVRIRVQGRLKLHSVVGPVPTAVDAPRQGAGVRAVAG